MVLFYLMSILCLYVLLCRLEKTRFSFMSLGCSEKLRKYISSGYENQVIFVAFKKNNCNQFIPFQ